MELNNSVVLLESVIIGKVEHERVKTKKRKKILGKK